MDGWHECLNVLDSTDHKYSKCNQMSNIMVGTNKISFVGKWEFGRQECPNDTLKCFVWALTTTPSQELETRGKLLQKFILSRDGLVKGTETRQG